MAKFNTATIEGFDAMSDAAKVQALLGLDIPDPVDLSGYVKKSVFDAKASEAANLSKKLKEIANGDQLAQMEAEKAQQEAAQKYADLEAKYNEVIKKNRIAEYKANYLAQGYDEELAASTAEAYESGDAKKVFENGMKFRATLESKIKADIMKGNPHPGGSLGGNNGPEDANVESAKNIGKKKAAENKKTADVMKYYS